MTNKKNSIICDFCGEVIDSEDILILKGIQACICEDCIYNAMELVKGYAKPRKKINGLKIDIKPSVIYNYLNQYVIGQDYAKKVLSVAVYNHYKCLDYNLDQNKTIELDKSNVMLIGPTGSGKTYLIKTLSKMLNVPYAIADACSLTESGYVGTDVEDVLKKLIDNADGDIELAQKGIVYIDEIDKLARKGQNPSTTRDVGGEGVQQALLKMIEGNVIDVPLRGNRRHPMAETMSIDTSNILFIVGGSFEGIEEIIKKRTQEKTSIGFGSNIKNNQKTEYNKYILDITTEDLKNFGLIPELIGRVPVICPLTELTEQELSDILLKPKNALVKQYKKLLQLDNVDLDFENKAIKAIAKQAIIEKTGARGLRSIIEKILLPYMYDIPDQPDLQKILITKECITNNAKPYLSFINKEKLAE